MKGIKFLFITLSLYIVSLPAIINAQITIDGNFDDWIGINPYVTDNQSDNGGGNGDLIAGYYTNDETTLYLKTEVAGTFLPVDWTNYYVIYIDTDKSTSTGLTYGWWTMGADYRVVIFNSVQYLQVFMGTTQSEDKWGWDGTVDNSKTIIASFNNNACELGLLFSDIGVTSDNSIWIQWRAEPGTDAMPEFSSVRTDAHLSKTMMKVLVPAYFSSSDANWERLVAQAATMPGQLYAIANLNDGPGVEKDYTFSAVLENMHNNNGRILGYVYTSYGNRTIDLVKSDIDKWYQFYPSIDGIFLDEQPNVPGKEAYYMEIYNYIKGKNSISLVVTNPGVNTTESYLFYNGTRIADVICIFDSDSGFEQWEPASWCYKYSSINFYVLPYNTNESQYVARVDRAKERNVGWIYCTDDNGNNPWDRLPKYFENFCEYILTGIFTPMPTDLTSKIKIDGHFDDWKDIVPLNISESLLPGSYSSDTSANIKNVWATYDSTNFYMSFQVSSDFEYTKYFYHVFIDVTNDSLLTKAGFVYKDSAAIGAEFMLENDNMWKYTGSGGSEWGWSGLSGIDKADSANITEISIPLRTLVNNNSKVIKFFVQVNEATEPYSIVSAAPFDYMLNYYEVKLDFITGVNSKLLLQTFILYNNFPNPFNPTTNIRYQLSKTSNVTLTIYNMLGQEVVKLVDDETQLTGTYNVVWNGKDALGNSMASGIYFYQLKADGFISSKKMVLIK